jgi:predicted house-cleaning NTP pyrophosphatase (Maf/HAM1 superfamily)
VRTVEGDYENVVGLPLAALLDLEPELLSRRGG